MRDLYGDFFPPFQCVSPTTKKPLFSPIYTYISTVAGVSDPSGEGSRNGPFTGERGKEVVFGDLCSCGETGVDYTPTGIPVCGVHLVTEMLGGVEVTDGQHPAEVHEGARLIREWNQTPDPGSPTSDLCRCGRSGVAGSVPPGCRKHTNARRKEHTK